MDSSQEHRHIEDACTRLCIDFAMAVDGHDDAAALAVFAQDGAFQTPMRSFNGHAQIADFLSARPRSVITRHVCTNIRIAPGPAGQASGRCYVVCFKAPAGAASDALPPTPHPFFVEYRDRFTHTAQGWRIQQRTVRPVFEPAPASPE